MAIDCSEGVYTLKFTDLNKNPISVNKKTLDQNALDIALLGRARQEYGDYFDENLLHILENFACEEDSNNPGTPDLTGTYANLLAKPVQGQKWYNKTTKKMFFYDGSIWIEMGTINDVGGNSGIIAHGMTIPLPISPSGYSFSYEECAWVVNLFNTPDQVDYAICTSDGNGVVTAQYKVLGDTELTNGYAFYQIIGIRGVKGSDDTVHPTPTPTPTISLTPSVTQSRAATPTPTPEPTVTRTPVASVTPTRAPYSPTPTPTKTISHTPTKTIPPTPSPSRTKSPTPTPSKSVAIQGCGPCYTNCPLTTALLPDGRTAGEVKVGDTLLLADEKTLQNYAGIVSYSEKAIEASVKVVTLKGVELSCTKTAPLATDNGFIYAADVMGLNLAVMINGKATFDEVVSVEDIGDQEVQHITVDNKAFWVGDKADNYVLHHNMKWCCDARGNCESMPPSECGCYVC